MQVSTTLKVKVFHSPQGPRIGAGSVLQYPSRWPAGDVSRIRSRILSLLSPTPAVTFPDSELHRQWPVLPGEQRYVWVNYTCLRPLTAERPKIELATSISPVQRPTDNCAVFYVSNATKLFATSGRVIYERIT